MAAVKAGEGGKEGTTRCIAETAESIFMLDMFYDLQNKETNKSLLNAIKILCVVAR